MGKREGLNAIRRLTGNLDLLHGDEFRRELMHPVELLFAVLRLALSDIEEAIRISDAVDSTLKGKVNWKLPRRLQISTLIDIDKDATPFFRPVLRRHIHLAVVNAAIAVMRIDSSLRNDAPGKVRLNEIREHRPVDERAIGIEPLEMPACLTLADDGCCREGRQRAGHEREKSIKEGFHSCCFSIKDILFIHL